MSEEVRMSRMRPADYPLGVRRHRVIVIVGTPCRLENPSPSARIYLALARPIFCIVVIRPNDRIQPDLTIRAFRERSLNSTYQRAIYVPDKTFTDRRQHRSRRVHKLRWDDTHEISIAE